MSTIEDRILRLEVAAGLAEPPLSWVNKQNIDKLKLCGFSISEASRLIINNFGEIPDKLRYYTDKLDSTEEHF